VLRRGLDELYRQVVNEWGTGNVQHLKSAVLCLLARTAEPLDAKAIAYLHPDLDEDNPAHVELAQQLLNIFRPVLRSGVTSLGSQGWSLEHDSLRQFLGRDSEFSIPWAAAGRLLAEASFGFVRTLRDRLKDHLARDADLPSGRPSAAMLRMQMRPDHAIEAHLLRHAVRYLVENGRGHDAASLLSDFDYLLLRTAFYGAWGVGELLADYERSAATPTPNFPAWRNFIRQSAHILRRSAARSGMTPLLLQIAHDYATESPITQAADNQDLPTIYMQPIWRPRRAPHPALILEGHTAAVTGVIELEDGRLVSWSDDGTIRVWDPRNGAQLAAHQGHVGSVARIEAGEVYGQKSGDATVAGVLEFSRDAFVSWSESEVMVRDLISGAVRGRGDAVELGGIIRLRDGRFASWRADGSIYVSDWTSSGQAIDCGRHAGPVRGAIQPASRW
jgi:hypothetical protein